MKRDLITTFITQFLVLLSGIIVYKLAASDLGKSGFSEYALSRRNVSLIHTALLMGLGVAIPRYIAYANENRSPISGSKYFVGGLFVVLLVVLSFVFFANRFDNQFAYLAFGNAKLANMTGPICFMLIGMILHSSCYSYFRGNLLMLRANALQVINMGIVPIMGFLIFESTAEILFITGVIWLLVSLVFLLSILRKLKIETIGIISHTREILHYGLQRVPGDFGLAFLLTLPAIFAAHMMGLKEAGGFAFGISVLNMTGRAFAPIGLVFLPKTSQVIARKDIKLLHIYVYRLLKVTMASAFFAVLAFEIFASKIIAVYLGEDFLDLVLLIRVIMIAGFAYPIFVSMRSIIDAYYFKAVNTINICISVVVFLFLSGLVASFLSSPIYLASSFAASILLLGSLTLLQIKKIV